MLYAILYVMFESIPKSPLRLKPLETVNQHHAYVESAGHDKDAVTAVLI